MQAVTTNEAALRTGLSVSFLKQARVAGSALDGPPYLKFGRSVRYLVADLDEWMARHRVIVGGTSEGEAPDDNGN